MEYGNQNEMANLPTENNNPGDLRDVGQAGASQGQGGFASFPDPKQGYSALLNDIQTKINRNPNETLGDFSNTYAPSSDNNNSAQYTANLANQLDVAPDATIGSLEPNIGKFADAIAHNEGYQTSQDDDQKTSDTDFSPVDIGLGLVGAVGTGLGALWKYAKAPLTDAATDAVMGGLLGAPEGGVGAIPGALAGAGAGIVQGIVSDVTSGGNQQTPPQTSAPASDSSTETPPPAEEGPTSEVPTEAQNIIADSTKAELNRRIDGRTLSQSPEGNLGIPTMAENGYVPENNNGNADYSAAMEDSKASVAQAANVEKQAAGGSVVPMSEVLATAKQNIQSSNVAPDIKQETLEHLDKISKSYGTGDISGGDAIEARHQQYAAVKKDWAKMGSSEIEARKALGTAFRDTSLAHSNNRDLQRAAIFEQQKHISAQKVMKKLHNHPLSKKAMHPFRQQLFKMAATAAEAWIGDKIGGTVGAILGYAAGSQINRVLEKKLKKTNFDTPEMKKALTILRDSKPGAFTHFKKTLERNHIEIPDLKEEPKTETGKEEQVEQDIPAIKKNPKKGKKVW